MLDLSLYLVVGQGDCQGRELIDLVLETVSGGVSAVQLREKHAQTREFIDLARALKRRLTPRGVPLIINDRVDVALAVGAQGVHVGQKDMHPLDVRQVLGEQLCLGLSAQTEDQLLQARGLPVDYIGLGPVYKTQTKADAGPALGITEFARLRSLVSLPVLAIGAVNQDNAARVLSEGGADGVAVVSALCAAPVPRQAAERLRAEVRQGLDKRAK